MTRSSISYGSLRMTTRRGGLRMAALAAGLMAAASMAGLYVAPAQAQMAAALGKPLPVSDLEPGTVTVRVVAGGADKPLVGIDVKLVSPTGAERTARTDAEGRAVFSRLEPGLRFVARAVEPAAGEGEQPKEAVSDEFVVPDTGGIRLMLSTRPWQEAGGPPGAGAAGAGPMLDPRQMSGIARPDPAEPARQLSIAAVRGIVTNKVPGHMVHLVAYGADGTVYKMSKPTGPDGRALFPELIPGKIAYYAMTAFTRGEGQSAVIDRVTSSHVTMPPEVGVRLMLAAPDASKTADPAIDDLERIEAQDVRTPGQVLVRLYGMPAEGAAVELYEIGDAGTQPVLVTTAPVGAPAPTNVTGRIGDAVQQPGLPDRSLAVDVVYGRRGEPVPGASIELVAIQPAASPAQPAGGAATRPAPAQAPAAAAPTPAATAPTPLIKNTDSAGNTTFPELVAGAQYRAVVTVYGTRVESAPFTVPQTGGIRLTALMDWQVRSNAEASITGVAADKLYFAQVQSQGQVYRSMPFLMVADRGAAVQVMIYPRLIFSFHISAEVDDEYLGFRGQIEIRNLSYAPYDPGPDGLFIPLPKGAVGGAVAEDVQMQVKVDPDHGLFWRGAVPPVGTSFLAGFSLPVEDGNVSFHMDLPYGMFNSSLVLLKTPGMMLQGLPPGVTAEERTSQTGYPLYVLREINIAPNQAMVFGIVGLPQRSALQRYLTLGAGILVLALLGWTALGIARHRRVLAASAGLAANAAAETGKASGKSKKLSKRREELLEELVALDANKKAAGSDYKRERARLVQELESIYAELDKAEGRGSASGESTGA